MRIFHYEIKLQIRKIPKSTAEGIFSIMGYHLRGRGENTPPLTFKVSEKMYKEIKRLAKEDYDSTIEGDEDVFPSGEDISYYDFKVIKHHPFGYVTFQV